MGQWVVSEGGLELSSARDHLASFVGTATHSEQAFRNRGRLLSLTRIHPHSSAPVSREVSRARFAVPLGREAAGVP